MDVVTVEVDFNFSLDGEHTPASFRRTSDPDRLQIGQRVHATDGEDTYWAVVTDLDRDRRRLELFVYFDEPVRRGGDSEDDYQQAV